jgi:alpha-glucosidase
MADNMRFWLDRGVDGFRVDVIWLLLKDEQLRDEEPNPDFELLSPILQRPHHRLQRAYSQNLPGVHDVIREFRSVVDEYDERVMIGEIYLSLDELMTYYGRDLDECHLPYNFHLILEPWDAAAVRRLVEAYEASLPDGAWPNWVTGNHDQQRAASRVGVDQARVSNMLLLTLRGTPTTYYGEELGMEDVPIPAERLHDPPALNQPHLADQVGRDPVRTPMRWDATRNAGFTDPDARPWLPVGSDAREGNVEAQAGDARSMLGLYAALTSLRQAEVALFAGDYATVESGAEDVFAYLRRPPAGDGAGSGPGAASFLVVLNFAGGRHELDLRSAGAAATIEVSTGMVRRGRVALECVELEPDEGLVLRLD